MEEKQQNISKWEKCEDDGRLYNSFELILEVKGRHESLIWIMNGSEFVKIIPLKMSSSVKVIWCLHKYKLGECKWIQSDPHKAALEVASSLALVTVV